MHLKLRINQVDQCVYLESTISKNGWNKSEMINHICQAKIAFNSNKTLLTSEKISLKTRKNLLKTYLWSIVLHSCKTWTKSEVEIES